TDLEHARVGRDVKRFADTRTGVSVLETDRPAVRHHAAAPHVLAEGRERELLRDLRLADEGAAAVPADQVALANELIECRSERQARDTEVGGETSLGRDRLADAEPRDQLHNLLPDQLLLRHSHEGKHIARPVVKTI